MHRDCHVGKDGGDRMEPGVGGDQAGVGEWVGREVGVG